MSEPADPLREQLLEAAARVFASRGYYGTKIMDIVREAGLSSGAVYGRFSSKDELLTAAIVSSTIERAASGRVEGERVADRIIRSAERRGALTDSEALELEAFVAARRDGEVAEALVEAQRRRRAAIQPLVKAARSDGTIAPNLDVASVLYFIEAVHLGLLLQRGAGIEPPDAEAWDKFVTRLVGALGGERSSGASERGASKRQARP